MSTADATFDIAQIDGVTSAGVGIRGGERVLVVTVDRLESSAVGQVPETAGGLRTVVETQPPARALGILAQQSSGRTDRHRPVSPGISVGTHHEASGNPTGTSGFIMTDGVNEFLTGNNHVLSALEKILIGDPIYQPGIDDGGRLDGDVAARLRGFIEIEEGGTVDFAWANPTVDIEPGIFNLGNVGGDPASIEVQDTLVKSGRTTGVTQGHVDRVGTAAPIDFGEMGTVVFTDVLAVEMEVAGGDSGSPVIKPGGPVVSPAGLVFAKAGRTAYVCTAENIVDETGFEFVASEQIDVSFCGLSKDTVRPGEDVRVTVDMIGPESKEMLVSVEFIVNGVVVDSTTTTLEGEQTVASRRLSNGELRSRFGQQTVEASVIVRT